MKDITSNLTEKLKRTLEREHNSNSLYRFCRDIDYYLERGMNEEDAVHYVKWWYERK